MPFHITSDQELIRKTVRELAETMKGKPAEHTDRAREYPKEALASLAQLGLTAMLVPADKGGAGTDTVSYVLALEETARASGTLALVLNNLNAMGSYPVAMGATEATRGAVLPELISGAKSAAWALTEPASGSDLNAVLTHAKRTDEGYVLNGLKSFVVGAAEASWFIVFAKLDGAMSAFLVPADAAGVKVAPAERTMAFRGSDMAQVFFSNVSVPDTHLLGKEGAALELATDCLTLGKLGAAAIAIGIMQASYEDSIKYSGDREQFRTPIKNFQAIQWAIADMNIELRVSRLLAYAAADKRDRGEPYTDDVAAAKLYAGDASKHVTQKALRIHGGTGFMRDLPIERQNRDARATSIYAGTSEMQRAMIAAKALDL